MGSASSRNHDSHSDNDDSDSIEVSPRKLLSVGQRKAVRLAEGNLCSSLKRQRDIDDWADEEESTLELFRLWLLAQYSQDQNFHQGKAQSEQNRFASSGSHEEQRLTPQSQPQSSQSTKIRGYHDFVEGNGLTSSPNIKIKLFEGTQQEDLNALTS